MTEPISDEELAELRGWVTDWSFVYPRPEIRALLARLDDAEARAEKFSYSAEDVRLLIAEAEAERDAAVAELKAEIEDANELVELFKMALSERDAALASSPEGVVTLPKLGQRVRITTDDGMDHAHWRDGECGGERCLGDRSWANYDDARLLAQLQRVKRQEQSDD